MLRQSIREVQLFLTRESSEPSLAGIPQLLPTAKTCPILFRRVSGALRPPALGLLHTRLSRPAAATILCAESVIAPCFPLLVVTLIKGLHPASFFSQGKSFLRGMEF